AAIPGTALDGARFISDALEKGATAILATPKAAVDLPGRISTLISANPRATLAQLAQRFYPNQPQIICAVTGTNGKTSVASFLRQIWAHHGKRAASLGTLGVVTDGGVKPLAHTTPDPVAIHRILSDLTKEGVTHAVLEASSHGLAQHRLDGVKLAAGALTNLSRDHLDYHTDFDDYLSAKLRLFTHVIREGGVAVLNRDADCYEPARAAAEGHGLTLFDVGAMANTLKLVSVRPCKDGLKLEIAFNDSTYPVNLPLVGAFQASNALVAAGLALATGGSIDHIIDALGQLKGAEGRMECVAKLANGASVFIDYAHTPDALGTALRALRPHTEGRLCVVFGAGGDRDKGKRLQMGKIASKLADLVIITDDNPRNEDPAAIRRQIMEAAPGAKEIGDRKAAIEFALGRLGPGDLLIVAGKGHESGQTVKAITHPFKDADVIGELLKERGHP
ncbi:UDP-N-acetylmuramoyl-L-alanyl-D-glutamate--2,6-diaminopimelate ligase, partial [bacterium AH-315-P15]|nr:UDP-N-acetylmuramoyl-L-alanyl-D-glutamate--2,6-diaminopimelate ligase [bacterium AH-315-P15]